MTHCSVTEWIQIAFTVIAGMWAIILLRENRKERRAKFAYDLYNNFYNDTDIRDIIYYTDGNRDGRFPPDAIRVNGALERQIDKTIQYLNMVGGFVKSGVVNKKDMLNYGFEVYRILTNNEVSKYIAWLEEYGVIIQNLDAFDNFQRGNAAKQQ